jgi:hypothetical protein
MTVADIRDRSNSDYVEVVFLESAMFYKLIRKNRAFKTTLGLLRTSLEENKVLKIRLTSPESDVIEEIQK